MITNKTFKLSTLSIAMLSIASSIATPVFAAEEEEIEKIMVTGSRIARAEIVSSSPITVVTKVQLTNLGITESVPLYDVYLLLPVTVPITKAAQVLIIFKPQHCGALKQPILWFCLMVDAWLALMQMA